LFHREKKKRAGRKVGLKTFRDVVQRVSGGSRTVPTNAPGTSSGESEHHPEVLEVWFAGTHTDVGGGAVEDTVPSLADITLKWMIEQVEDSHCGIKFNKAAPATTLVSPARDLGSEASAQTLPGVVQTEKEEDVQQEVLTSIHHDTKSQLLWWLLELVPTRLAWQTEKGKWESKWM
jgi:hypothetical protein